MIEFDEGKWVNLEGLGEEALRELRIPAERTLKKATLVLEGTIKRKLTGKRSGRIYKVTKTGGPHVASAPGEPPANLWGDLLQSVGHSEPEWDGWTVSASVGPGLGQPPEGGRPDPAKAYARRLEYGGSDSRGVNIEPRPYMEPSVQEAEQPMDAIFKELGS